MKNLILLSFIVFVCFSGFSQTREIDSLKTQLKNPSLHDTIKIKSYFNLAGSYGGFSLDSLKKYTLKAIDLSKQNDDYFLDGAYFYMGSYYSTIGETDKSKDYYLKAMPLIDSIRDKGKLATVYNNYAGQLNETTELEEKIEYNLKALRLRKDVGNKYRIGMTQFNLAIIYDNTDIDSLASKYLKLAYQNAEESGNNLFTAHVLNALVKDLLSSDALEEAKNYLEKAEKICEETASSITCSDTFLSKAEYLDKLERYDEAESAFKLSLEYAYAYNDKEIINFIYPKFGKHYVLAKKPEKAIEIFKKYVEGKNNNSASKIRELLFKHWSAAEKMVGNYKKSNEYMEKYVSIRDSLNYVKNKKLMISTEAKFQSVRKDKEIAEQKLVLADQQLSIQESKSKSRLMTILIISLLLASILLWFVFQQRQKRIQQQLVSIQREQEVRTLESLIEGEEKERLRIAKELHDGVNGDLSAIKFKLSSLLKMNNDVINDAVNMIDNSCKQVRAISHNLVPPSLKNFSLVEAVSNYCENMNSIHKPEISFQTIGEPIDLNKKVEVNIFRIIQELVTNATKHANASTIDVQISNRDNTILITVEDNGKGYENKTEKQLGIGLDNIKSRVEYLNANFDVVTNKTGTYNTIEIDLNKIED